MILILWFRLFQRLFYLNYLNVNKGYPGPPGQPAPPAYSPPSYSTPSYEPPAYSGGGGGYSGSEGGGGGGYSGGGGGSYSPPSYPAAEPQVYTSQGYRSEPRVPTTSVKSIGSSLGDLSTSGLLTPTLPIFWQWKSKFLFLASCLFFYSIWNQVIFQRQQERSCLAFLMKTTYPIFPLIVKFQYVQSSIQLERYLIFPTYTEIAH